MVSVSSKILTAVYTKASSKIIRKMEKENKPMQTGIITLEISFILPKKDTVCTAMQMETDTKVSGKTICTMEKERSFLVMDLYIKGHGKRTSVTVKDF